MEIAGYQLAEPPLRATPLCASFRGRKGKDDYFVKIYHYGRDEAGKISAKKHRDVQERVRGVLRTISGVSEEIIDHGVIAALPGLPDTQSEAYYQVKPWLTAPNGQDHLMNTNQEIANLAASPDAEAAVKLRQRFQDLVTFSKLLTGLVARCHENRLIHQDLKPEQFLIVPDKTLTTGYRPVIADFDWGFFEGETPLRDVTTADWQSLEHAAGEPRRTASDVYTMAMIAFYALTLGSRLLLTRTEQEAGVDFVGAEWISLVKRSQASQKLEGIYSGFFPSESVNFEALRTTDQCLARCVEKDPAKRPSARELWTELGNLALFERPRDPSWFRLRGRGGTGLMTVRADYPDTLHLNRDTVRSNFGLLVDGEGDPLHKYFDSKPATPALVFSYSDGAWVAANPAEATNGFVLVKADGSRVEVGPTPTPITRGDSLVLLLKRRRVELDAFTLTIGE